MTGRDSTDLDIAVDAAKRGAKIARDEFRTDLAVETKRSKTDIVTGADRAAQTAIVEFLAAHRPTDAIVAEESPQPSTLPDEGRTWVIDPIDGTGNFARGSPLWTTSVTVVEDAEPFATANVMPALGDTYVADGKEFRFNGQAGSVSDRTDPATFGIAAMMGWGPDAPESVGAICRTVTDRFGELHRFRTGQTTMSMVAAGQLDGGITFSPGAPWDRIAGVHLIRAAGGTATDHAGEPWTLEADGLIVSNGTSHGELLDAAGEIRRRIDRAHSG